ncbi:4'-phosphopantetheinyl transferase family protein [Streptomyces adelaidensis]|uniref:4'-phosphopantetheinyl transferase family protein n=1 Tax=Streptomyces adelaidensis TaxID=2796465 RepID=UPI0019052FC1|nr:4'-phosphopantetheinyl transferase superfamily protein [Streptomyces adelaidensis]
MIERILPPYVAAVEAFSDPPGARLLPEERAVVAGAAEGRRREFTTVRHCARLALAELGRPPVPLLPDADGAPRWPDGAVGSMTHCRGGYRAAAVAPRTAARAIGVDAEPHRPLREGVLASVARPGERAGLAALERAGAAVCWDRLLFCAKEAVYKAWFPLTRVWLGFHDVEVDFEPRTDVFRARVVGVGAAAREGANEPSFLDGRLTGRWVVGHGVAAAAVALPSFDIGAGRGKVSS